MNIADKNIRITPVFQIVHSYLCFVLPFYSIFIAFYVPYIENTPIEQTRLFLYGAFPSFSVFCLIIYFTFKIIYAGPEGFLLKRLFSRAVYKTIAWDKIRAVKYYNFLVFSKIHLFYQENDSEKIIKFQLNKFSLPRFKVILQEHQLTLS